MELPGVPRDTPTAVERRVIAGLSAMTAAERLAATFALWSATDELALAGIRSREGELPEAELRLRLGHLRYGAETLARVEAHRSRLGR